MLPQVDARLLSPRTAIEKGLAVVPILIALVTGVVALLQVVNGLDTETTIETLILGWLLAAPTAALILWPIHSAVPTPDIGRTKESADTDVETDSDADDPIHVLRHRYAAGDIDEVEFERRLEDLLATEEQYADDSLATDPSGRHDRKSDRIAESE